MNEAPANIETPLSGRDKGENTVDFVLFVVTTEGDDICSVTELEATVAASAGRAFE